MTKWPKQPMVKFAKLLFAAVLGPIWIAVTLRLRIVPANFHGCYLVLGRYPRNLPLFHRAVHSWWVVPMDIYVSAVRDNRRCLEYCNA